MFDGARTITIDPAALERKITIPERNRAMVREFRQVMDNGYIDAKGVLRKPLFGKVIVFAVTKRHAETSVLLPPGPRVAFSGGTGFNDHALIWARLDQVMARHPDMVLLHGGSDRGAELIAARWADARKAPQIAFRPDWTRHAKAAPFRRNDAMLEAMPIGVIVLPGTGIQDNLADKARLLGIPVWRCGG
jgi:hypothetical protein